MAGPLPKPNARRRNAPTVATTKLPAGGRPGRAPTVPKPYRLGEAGRAWWKWAWKQPQAVHWEAGHLYVVVRRSLLEDELDALDQADPIDLHGALREALDGESVQPLEDIADRVEALIRGLRRVAGGSGSVMRQMAAHDKALGLTPKGMADLRWTIVAEPALTDARAGDAAVAARSRPRGLLHAVDPTG